MEKERDGLSRADSHRCQVLAVSRGMRSIKGMASAPKSPLIPRIVGVSDCTLLRGG